MIIPGAVLPAAVSKSAAGTAGSINFANPKSSSFTRPSSVMMMFAGFRSR
jgi:hypothetical protein